MVSDGLLLVTSIIDPLAHENPHTIRLTQIMTLPTLSLTFDELHDTPDSLTYRSPTDVEKSRGLSASLHVDSSDLQLDIVDSFGEFKMKRVWVRTSDDGSHDMELFQGYFLLNIFYGEEYEARGRAPIATHQLRFWGIRQNGDGSGNTGQKLRESTG
ncbi:hypothetical protein E1B28_007383 [Marasmius oreades]|uniref:Uncharacterized protein n=1 Tax=Marasmius oreades TaxID=181124 RepID=A0A9P7S1I8_9AGAR|nr:uncharacterized protein E1B28_007383 [Marasmius oreades]KAG7093731.1 hypothetical protein E1B28_007383 [Marasmius oreades]